MGGKRKTIYLLVAALVLAIGVPAAAGAVSESTASEQLPQVLVPPGLPQVPHGMPQQMVDEAELVLLPQVLVPPGWPAVPGSYVADQDATLETATDSQIYGVTRLSRLPQVTVPLAWPPVPGAYVNVRVVGIAYVPLPRVLVPPGWPQVPPAAAVELTYPTTLETAR